jgi:hypothetical protein
VEAGHRCAIPTCRATSGLEIHHIEDFAKVQTHEFENLILLCAICHSRATKREIDITSMRTYKANLSLIFGRYGDLEHRVLEYFVKHRDATEITVDYSHRLLLEYLIADGMLIHTGQADGAVWLPSDPEAEEPGPDDTILGPASWELTADGRELVNRLRSAREID